MSLQTVCIPGKTFLVGEYLALSGGPSVVVTTAPAFQFSWSVKESVSPKITHPFHQDSPAGRFLNRLKQLTYDVEIEFQDPYRGAGGFGGSTAEFLGSWMFSRWLTGDAVSKTDSQWCDELHDHREQVCPVWTSERFGGGRFMDVLESYAEFQPLASGADLVSQLTGGVAIWNRNKQVMRRFGWPFEGLQLSLLQTGKKLRTHEHLKAVTPLNSEAQQEMALWVGDAIQAFSVADGNRLSAAVRGVGKLLAAQGLVAEHTLRALRDLSEMAGVRAAKGCGAMGADVVAVLHDDSALPELKGLCGEHGFTLIESKLWTTAVRIRS